MVEIVIKQTISTFKMFTFKVQNSPSDFQFGHFIFKFGIIDTNFKAKLNLVLQNY